MKLIKYWLNAGNSFTEKALEYTDANLAIAAKEARNGEYTIEDDGNEIISVPTLHDRLALIEQFIAKIKSAFPGMIT